MENLSLKQWYLKAYPEDEYGAKIDKSATFQGLFEALDNYQNVYNYIGVADSIIRERVFFKLSKIMDVDYNYIYDQWLRGA